jgi:glycosyltransferase involved in cell wall biosynthesis
MRWYYLGRALIPLGVEVEIVSSANFHKYLSPPKVDYQLQSERVDGLAYHWVKTHCYRARGLAQVRNQLEFVFGCYRAARELSDRKPDVVIASSPHPLVNFPAAAIARAASAKFMIEVRDLWPEVLLELGNFRLWHPYIVALKAAESYGVRHAQKIISVKPGDGDYFRDKYLLTADKFCYIPNGFLPEVRNSAVPPVIKSLRGRYRFLVGYTGALSAYYCLQHMVELAKRFQGQDDLGFVVAGKGDREVQLAERVYAAGLTNFHFVGAIPKTAVQVSQEQFDVCYVGLEDLGIHRYGISCNKIYEYMYAAKPILGSYATDYDPVASARCGITARPGNYQPLVEGLEKLLSDDTLREQYGRRGRAYFDANHDFRVVAASLIRQLLLGNASRNEEFLA